jgi:hypothetical protein
MVSQPFKTHVLVMNTSRPEPHPEIHVVIADNHILSQHSLKTNQPVGQNRLIYQGSKPMADLLALHHLFKSGETSPFFGTFKRTMRITSILPHYLHCKHHFPRVSCMTEQVSTDADTWETLKWFPYPNT